MPKWNVDLYGFEVEADTEFEALEEAVRHLSDGGFPWGKPSISSISKATIMRSEYEVTFVCEAYDPSDLPTMEDFAEGIMEGLPKEWFNDHYDGYALTGYRVTKDGVTLEPEHTKARPFILSVHHD
jgi:hypothetical protein